MRHKIFLFVALGLLLGLTPLLAQRARTRGDYSPKVYGQGMRLVHSEVGQAELPLEPSPTPTTITEETRPREVFPARQAVERVGETDQRTQQVHSRRQTSRVYHRNNYRGSYGRGYAFGMGPTFRPVIRSYGYREYGGRFGGYGYGFLISGIKFHLELVPEKDRPLVKRGIVTVNGAEIGIVNRHDGFWQGPTPADPGETEVKVELEDGRVFSTLVAPRPGQALHVYLRFPPKGSETTSAKRPPTPTRLTENRF